MACRVTQLKPPCGYVLEGIAAVTLLDWEDFGGFGFEGNDLYSNCLVTDIEALGPYVDVQATTAKYTSAISGKTINHTLETFIAELSAGMLSQLQLALKRRYIPVFTARNGRSFTFGYEAGAGVTYAGQTEGAIGAVVTFSAPSVYPLFEVALTDTLPVDRWLPDFINGAYCETI